MFQVVIAMNKQRPVIMQRVKEVSEETSGKVWCGAHGWQHAWMGVCKKCMANYCKGEHDGGL